MSSTVTVGLGTRSYDVRVGPGLIGQAGALLAPFASGPVPIVTDENVAPLHLDPLVASLRKSGIDARPIVLPPGEGTKSFTVLEKLCRELVRLGVERGGLVVGFGGGVIGDLAGLAAGLLKRGIDIAQMPTTLLAQVDSSVGGKTAIDVPEGKNLIGLFHQPRIVLADTRVLTTLPCRQSLSGYAEVVKYAVLGDAEFFGWLEANGAAALSGDQPRLEYLIAHCCRMKADIVARDERETGDRALLNLGHTFGHALEAAAGYSDTLLHGEAVAIGLVLAVRLSERLGYSTPENTERVVRHLRVMGLPAAIREIAGATLTPELVLGHMRHDKKAQAGKLRFVLVRTLGQAFVSSDVPVEAIEAVLAG